MTDVDTPPQPELRSRHWPGRGITVGGVTVHVRETPGPDGVPAVHVHGLACSATNRTDLAGLLSTRAAGTAVGLPALARRAGAGPAARRDGQAAARELGAGPAVTRGRSEMLPGVGHVGQIEAPDAVATAVTRMWDDVAAGRWRSVLGRTGADCTLRPAKTAGEKEP